MFSEPEKRQETTSPERRRTARARPTGLTYVKLGRDNGGTLVDVCESGIRFQVVAPVENRGRIQVWFVLDAANQIEVAGELAWIDETRRSGGLKFSRPSKQVREKLRSWLSLQNPENAMREPLPPSPAEVEARFDVGLIQSDFEGQLQELPHTDPAPLERLLNNILTSLQRPHPEEIFANPALAQQDVPAASPTPEFRASAPESETQDGFLRLPSVADRIPAVDRSETFETAPSSEATRPLPNNTLGDDAAAPKTEQSSELKFAEFRLSVNRVSGMLSMLREAIASDESDWPLTEPPEVPPVVAAPTISTTIEPPLQPIATAAAIDAEETADADDQAEIDVRPWAAGAPWRAAPAPVAAPSWRVRFAGRLNDYGTAVREVVGHGVSRALSATAAAGSASWKATARFSRVAVSAFSTTASRSMRSTNAALSSAAAQTSRAAKAATSATAGRASQVTSRWRPGELVQSFRGKVADAAGSAKKASTHALAVVIPGEPTSTDIRMLVGITAVLLVSLVAFSYRGKFESPVTSVSIAAISEPRHPDSTADQTPVAATTPVRRQASRRTAPVAAPAQTEPTRTEQQEIVRRPSTPEFATALAYLGANGSVRNPSVAAQWLWAASRKGDTGASIVLADLYLRGDGVPQNCAQGRVLLLAASRKGDEEATRKLQEVDAGSCGSSAQ